MAQRSSASLASGCAPCGVLAWVAAILFFMMTLLSLMGVYTAHMVSGSLRFGVNDGALYIVAFCVSMALWTKKMSQCCGCCERRK